MRLVQTSNCNKDGWPIEWHPLASNIDWRQFETDANELGFVVAFELYDENVWG